MRRVVKFVLFLLAGLTVYEGYRLIVASNKTNAVFSPYQAASYRGVRWDDLPNNWLDIWLRVEDPRFFSHPGLDLTTPGAGLTTLTQALVKRLYFDAFSPGFSKLEQSLIAVLVVSPRISKEDQITAALALLYFGTVSGRDVVGFEDAAQTYYEKPLNLLSDQEFVGLVAMLVRPNLYRPGSAPHDDRVARINRMLEGECAPLNLSDVLYRACGPSVEV